MASFVCAAFIAYLFWADGKRERLSSALWIPLCWMFIAGSRYVSTWLGLRPNFTSAAEASEGSPIDAATFMLMIALGALVLIRRRIDWRDLLSRNAFIFSYFAFCLMSALWTEDVGLLVKRWLKDLGNPIMTLVILTEARPYVAAGATLRRLTFLLIPLSFLFVKYIPELGRAYHPDGSPMYTGAGSQKNDLGLICLVAGFSLVWDYLYAQRPESFSRNHKLAGVALMVMTAWLLRISDSQTATVCLAAGSLILMIGRAPFLMGKPGRLIGLVSGSLAVAFVLETTIGLKDSLLQLIGRDPSLTNRTDVWATVLAFEVNPLLGTGFMSFWSGARMDEIQTRLAAAITQAHNGYLEQYLNLGYVGLAFIVIILIVGLAGAARQMTYDVPGAMFRFCCIAMAIMYNFTEASFYGINNMWFLLLLGCVAPPRQHEGVAAPQSATVVDAPAVRFPRRLAPRRSEPERAARGRIGSLQSLPIALDKPAGDRP